MVYDWSHYAFGTWTLPDVAVNFSTPFSDLGYSHQRNPADFEYPKLTARDRFHLMTTAAPAYLEGLDINRNQAGQVLDVQAIKNSGRAFVILEATWGLYAPPTFAAFWPRLVDAGFFVMAYGFFDGSLHGGDQADFLLDTVAPLWQAQGYKSPLFLDVEAFTGDIASVPQRASNFRLWIPAIRAETRPGVYSNVPSWQNLMNNEPLPADVLGWPAHWANTTLPALPAGWRREQSPFHQYGVATKHDWCPAVPGMASDVDVDRFYGTLDNLYALAEEVPPEPEPEDEPMDLAKIKTELLKVVASLNVIAAELTGEPVPPEPPPPPTPPPPPPVVDTDIYRVTGDKAIAYYDSGPNASGYPKMVQIPVEERVGQPFKNTTGQEVEVYHGRVEADGTPDFWKIYGVTRKGTGEALYLSEADGKIVG